MKTSKFRWMGAAILSLLFTAVAFGQPAATPGRGPAAPRVVSPEILPDKQVTFRLYAPKASEVTLSGHWENGTNVPLTKDEKGIWFVTVGPLAE
jgi:enterochelin esterase family protein